MTTKSKLNISILLVDFLNVLHLGDMHDKMKRVLFMKCKVDVAQFYVSKNHANEDDIVKIDGLHITASTNCPTSCKASKEARQNDETQRDNCISASQGHNKHSYFHITRKIHPRIL